MTKRDDDIPAHSLADLIRQIADSQDQPTLALNEGEKMRDLNYQIKQICQRNRDGSIATQSNRERILTQSANRLHDLGYSLKDVRSLKPKHIEALVKDWIAKGLSAGTIKNRMAELRWLAEKVGKQNIVARSNDFYAIDHRKFVTNVSKARTLEAVELAKVTDAYTRLSLRFQSEFGLRREESIKIRPTQADHGDRLVLQASWCKGGREREIPILTETQRQLVNEAKQFAGAGSLIPRDMSYKQQLKRFENQCHKAGIDHVHGHRHAYAQRRYLELTGRDSPAAGGKTSKQLTAAEKVADREARLTISRELGHERESVTAVYLGR
jgi:Phage integrase, N-terminal/Integrase